MNQEEVIYNGEMYVVIFKYNSGYWEILKKDDRHRTTLVHMSEVEPLK